MLRDLARIGVPCAAEKLTSKSNAQNEAREDRAGKDGCHDHKA
jgi:hypothetical protein